MGEHGQKGLDLPHVPCGQRGRAGLKQVALRPGVSVLGMHPEGPGELSHLLRPLWVSHGTRPTEHLEWPAPCGCTWIGGKSWGRQVWVSISYQRQVQGKFIWAVFDLPMQKPERNVALGPSVQLCLIWCFLPDFYNSSAHINSFWKFQWIGPGVGLFIPKWCSVNNKSTQFTELTEVTPLLFPYFPCSTSHGQMRLLWNWLFQLGEWYLGDCPLPARYLLRALTSLDTSSYSCLPSSSLGHYKVE